ncbi:MAG TPA: hypothetical protein GX729_03210 [Firmicutes bacterium]|nr:hypothetical protein [Bacillota bacterium]
MELLGTWLNAIFTILLLSVVFKDNPLYRFAENTYVGLYAGYTVALQWFQYIRPSIQLRIMQEGKWWYIFPVLIGLMIYTRYVRPIAWISRYHICFLLGIGSAYYLTTQFKPMFIDQIRATFLPLWVAGDWWQSVSNILYIVGTFSALVYFLFTVEKKGVQGKISSVGRWVMMLAFGAAFGNTVMARVSLFLGRMQFLLGDWVGLIK